MDQLQVRTDDLEAKVSELLVKKKNLKNTCVRQFILDYENKNLKLKILTWKPIIERQEQLRSS